jgi:excisionase family DNA binding protein
MEKLLNVKQLSNLLSIKPGTIRYYVSIGFLPHYKIRGLVRFSEKDVIEWLEKRKRGGRLIIVPKIDPEGDETEKS